MRRVILLLAVMAATLVVASGVALAVNKIGTNGPDTLRGTNAADNLDGRGGNDVLYGLGGRDNLLGGESKDWVLGGNEERPLGGDKNLLGGPGNDGMFGGTGPDNMLGGSGNDFASGDPGSDTVVGEEGRDIVDGDAFIVNNRPAMRDIVSCGGGFDRVAADTKDQVAPDCERVRRGPAVHEELEEMFEELGFVEVFEGLAPFPQG